MHRGQELGGQLAVRVAGNRLMMLAADDVGATGQRVQPDPGAAFVVAVELMPQAGQQRADPAEDSDLAQVRSGAGEEPVVGAGLVGDPEMDLEPVPEPEAGDLPDGDARDQGDDRDQQGCAQRPDRNVLTGAPWVRYRKPSPLRYQHAIR